jgi:hypothetical protein
MSPETNKFIDNKQVQGQVQIRETTQVQMKIQLKQSTEANNKNNKSNN